METTPEDEKKAAQLADVYPGKTSVEVLKMFEADFEAKSAEARLIADTEEEVREYVWGSVECELMRNVPRSGGKPEEFEVIPVDVVFPKDLAGGQHISGNIIGLVKHDQLTNKEFKLAVIGGTQSLDDGVIDGMVNKIEPGGMFTSLFTSRFDGNLGFCWAVPDSLDLMKSNGSKWSKEQFLGEIKKMKASMVTLQDVLDHYEQWNDDGKLYLSALNPCLMIVDAWRGRSKKGNTVGFLRVGDSSLKEPVKVMSELGGIAARVSFEQVRYQSGKAIMLFEVTEDTNNLGTPMLDVHGVVYLGGKTYVKDQKEKEAKGENSFKKDELATLAPSAPPQVKFPAPPPAGAPETPPPEAAGGPGGS